MKEERKYKSPPFFAEWILGSLLNDKTAQTPLGDFEEFYHEIFLSRGRFAAYKWYWGQVLNLLPRILLNSMLWGFVMLNNYFKIALRSLIKSKGYSFINISGLAIGIACSFLILLYVQSELGYDNFHENADDIYRVAWISNSSQTRTPHPMAEALKNDMPEVVDAVSMSPIWGPGLTRPIFSVRYEDKVFDEGGFFSADTNFFTMFSFKMIEGDPYKALRTFGGIVITESIAQKYFGNESALGKRIMLNNNQDWILSVTGVIEDIPYNSHFHFNFLLSYLTLKAVDEEGSDYYTWADFGHYNYIKLHKDIDPKIIEAKIPDWARNYFTNMSEDDYRNMKEGRIGFKLQRITDIHLHSNIKWELEANGDITYVYIFSSAAFLILLIACVNFMNLTIARALTRTKEIGVRKVIGAERKQLFNQFFGETIISTLISIIIAAIIIHFAFPLFAELTNSSQIYSALLDSNYFFDLLAIAVVATLVAGSYPAMYLSGLKPVKILKGEKLNGSWMQRISKGMVVFQFTVSIILIIGAQVVSSQLNYVSNKKLGFDKEQVVVVPFKGNVIRERSYELKSEILNDNGIISASGVSNVPGINFNRNEISWGGSEENLFASEFFVDEDFVKTLGLEIVEGRTFSRDFRTDAEEAFILNETAARGFDWDTPIGKEITYLGDIHVRTGKVIGVVKDFHFKSLHNSIEPMVIQITPRALNFMLIKIDPADINSTVASIEKTWTTFDQEHEFEYFFLDDSFNALYKSEKNMQSLFSYFTILAIFIASMGLFGLSILNTQKRIKEIGIRKTLGSSIPEILQLIVKDYLKLVLMANIIACPVAYYVMAHWLQKFAFRTEIGVTVFIISAVVMFLITTLTVLSQAIKAATINPVDSLRSE